jgi:hypothetical protein
MASQNSYRADVTIIQIHRTGLPAWQPGQGVLEVLADAGNAKPQRTYTVHEAFPIRVKPAGDLDASTADVSVAEADVAYEWFSIQDIS